MEQDSSLDEGNDQAHSEANALNEAIEGAKQSSHSIDGAEKLETAMADANGTQDQLESQRQDRVVPAQAEYAKLDAESTGDVSGEMKILDEASQGVQGATESESGAVEAPLLTTQQELARQKAILNMQMMSAASNSKGVPGQRNIVESNDNSGVEIPGIIKGIPDHLKRSE